VRIRDSERIELGVFIPTHPINDETSGKIGGPMDLVPGDVPQPGETPREESNPWRFDPDAAFWHGDADRDLEDTEGPGSATNVSRPVRGGPAAATQAATLLPPLVGGADGHTGEAADAHTAGAGDAAAELAGSTPADPADHDQADDQGFNPTPTSEYATTTPRSRPVGEPVHSPESPEHGHGPGDVPDVMVLPEPNRNRPTVALDRGPTPGQPPAELSRRSYTQQRPPSPLLENSPFWLTDEERAERAAAWPPAETRDEAAHAGVKPRRKPRTPHRPATGLVALIALGLIAAFFAWVSAEPFWLAMGHGNRGTAMVAQCTGDGVTQRCAGQFQSADGRYAVATVTLLGVEPGQRNPGAVSPARMVSPQSRQAYVGETGLLVHLRWMLGFLLVLLCGLGIAGLTGARQLETVRARRRALTMSVTGPLLLLAGFLFATY
jgi:hypothetical protein